VSNLEPILRKLKSSDISDAARLSAEAGWNQAEDDWRLLIALAPEGCFGIEVAGELVSTATLICYGRQLAWIGMVLTRSSFQGRGFARRLLTEILSLADRLNIESVKLDATDQGRPLYEKLGFRDEQAVERWERVGSADPTEKTSYPETRLSADLIAADSVAFGVNRSELLLQLAKHTPPRTLGQSYLLTRSGRLRQYLGPCVADSPDTARNLIEDALQSSRSSSWYWDLFVENADAISLARTLEFAPKRKLVRMVRGKDMRGEEHSIYALAGFELG
jgi:GNAT superfamily N-acetyltransferase